MNSAEKTRASCGLGGKSFNGVCICKDDAAEAFFEIAELFYDGGFGSANKQDVELKMFKVFEAAVLKSTGHEPSDLYLAKKLGITPQMVRNRRIKLVLRGEKPQNEWTEVLLDALKSKTYVIKKAKGSCEIKIMLPSKMAVYEFEDVLVRRGHYFDKSFNDLVVRIPVSSLFEILFRELADIEPPPGASTQNVLGFLLNKARESQVKDERLEKIINEIWGDEAAEKVTDVAKKGAAKMVGAALNVFASGIGLNLISGFAGSLSTLAGFWNIEQDGGPDEAFPATGESRLPKTIGRIATLLSKNGELRIDEDSFSEDELNDYYEEGYE